ncbi:AbrB/MazE/SpoVT family DNA-binding domain-containing protein [uncultured Thiohalocapsa sp.]|uniref:AbrB/MazE/SpoVT family DNA-binding domain-containing protein n=1 Tax=uncultured Thiohalocapsa sp. TaxID=768990 RepID=UPI0025F0FE9D|nr:AbrB/MazE/SpoVT family DNA-binding domain-containing protein [uncultured Thiohalocapsa sp.]
MPTVTVSDNCQAVIPAAIRRRLGVVPGSRLDVELEGDNRGARAALTASSGHPDPDTIRAGSPGCAGRARAWTGA